MSIFNLLLNDDEIDKTEFFAVIDEALDLYADYLDLINLDESAERYAKIDAAQNRYMGSYHTAKSSGDAEGAKKHLAMAHKAGNIKVNMLRKGKVKPANPDAGRKPMNPRDDRADGSIRDHVEPAGDQLAELNHGTLSRYALAALANKRQNSKVADIASKEGDIPGAMDALRKVEKRTAGINKVYDRSKTR